jgi:hypothetical protein
MIPERMLFAVAEICTDHFMLANVPVHIYPCWLDVLAYCRDRCTDVTEDWVTGDDISDKLS